MNDGLQPWFSNRKRFDLRTPRSYAGRVNEEGLAAINTIYQAQVKMLFLPALLYCTYLETVLLTGVRVVKGRGGCQLPLAVFILKTHFPPGCSLRIQPPLICSG